MRRYANHENFEIARDEDKFQSGDIVSIGRKPDIIYGYTSDGMGFHWYDTLAELKYEHC